MCCAFRTLGTDTLDHHIKSDEIHTYGLLQNVRGTRLNKILSAYRQSPACKLLTIYEATRHSITVSPHPVTCELQARRQII